MQIVVRGYGLRNPWSSCDGRNLTNKADEQSKTFNYRAKPVRNQLLTSRYSNKEIIRDELDRNVHRRKDKQESKVTQMGVRERKMGAVQLCDTPRGAISTM